MRRRIVVLGATGRTGRLVAAELADKAGVLLVGRSRESLEMLGTQHRLAVRVGDVAGLAGVLVPGDVLLNCVGPYDLLGDQVVSLAIRSGVTYVDVAGEPAFLRRVYGRLGEQARIAGSTLIPAVGYEFMPGTVLADRALTSAAGQARRVEVAYFVDGGLDAGSSSGRRALLRAMAGPTTTFRSGRHVQEPVASRRSRFRVGGRDRSTVSLGGAEVWTLPVRFPGLRDVDVHTGWFGAASPLVSAVARGSAPFRRLPFSDVPASLADRTLRALGDGDAAGLAVGTSRFVVRASDGDGTVVAREEAVGGNAIVLAARLAAGVVDTLADMDLRDLPPGATDPVTLFGPTGATALLEWAGVVRSS